MNRVASSLIAACLLLAGAAALLGGCGAGGPSGGRVDVEGYVSGVWGANAGPGSGDVPGSILVDGGEGAGGYGKASVAVTANTAIWDVTGGATRRAAFKDLEVGQLVRVTFTGPVAESYPVQATAGEIIIARRTDAGKILERHREDLMSVKGVAGFGVSSRNGEPVIVIFLESDDPGLPSRIPRELEGITVVTEVTGPIEALPL